MTHLRWQHILGAFSAVSFAVRYTQNLAGAWETAIPMHGGLVSDTRFALPPIASGRYLFMVKAVNPADKYSATAAILDANFVYAAPGAETARFDHTAAGYPATRVNLVIGGTAPNQTLCTSTGTTSPFRHAATTGDFWTPDRAVFWAGNFVPGTYTVDIQFTAGLDAGRYLRLKWAATTGSWGVQYCVVAAGNVEGPYAPWPGTVKIVQDRYYRLRWLSAGHARRACRAWS